MIQGPMKGKIKVTSNVQEVREQSFERVINDAQKAKERLINVVMRDKYMPSDCQPRKANMGQGGK